MAAASALWLLAAQAPEHDYRSRERGHFTVRFEGYEETELAFRALEILNEAYEEIRGRLRVTPADPIEVVIYTGGKYRESVGGPDWSAARYDGKIRVGQADLMAARGRLKDILYHEYAHALLSAAGEVPAWFHEGVAQYLEPSRPRPDNELLARAAKADKLFTFTDLEAGFVATSDAHVAALAYCQALSIVEFLIAERGEDRFHGIIRQLVDGRSFSDLFEQIYGDRVERTWRGSLPR